MAFTVADGKVVSSNVSLLGADAEGPDYRRGCFLFMSVCRGEPAWRLALDQLGVVGGDAVRDVGQWEMGRDSVCRRRILGVMDATPRVASMATSMASRVCGT